MRTTVHTALALLMFIACHSIAVAEKRVALVIGNSDYAQVERLKNPVNDAKRLSESLTSIGFDKVTLKLDLPQGELRRTLGQFSRDAAGADIALIYFAGHGIEVGGTNYIIPTDANLRHVDDVEFEALPLGTMLSALNRAGKLKLVILDACRNNPFQEKMASTGSNRSIGRGLARVSPTGSDTLVAYAAKEGTVADDGSGDNSPFTKALVKHITTPGIDVRLLFGRVRDDVLKSTGRRQEPFTYGSLGGTSIYLRPPQTVAVEQDGSPSSSAPLTGQADKELVFWNTIKDSKDIEDFRSYLSQFPGGVFSSLAKNRIKRMTKVVATANPTAATANQKVNPGPAKAGDKPSEAKKPKRGLLGVRVQAVTDTLAGAFGLAPPRGAIVSDISPGSAADKAGMLAGDIILSLSGTSVEAMRDLPQMVGKNPPGTKVVFGVQRDRKLVKLNVTLGGLKRTASSAKPKRTNGGDTRAVSIVQLNETSKLYEMGVRAGDLIRQVNGKRVRKPEDVRYWLDQARKQGWKEIAVLVKSHKVNNQRFVGLALAEVKLDQMKLRSFR